MPILETMGAQAAGVGMGLLLEKHNDRRQREQQDALSRQQLGYDKQMTDYQFQKQLQMWKDTNYSAQIEQLEKAGLNPAMIYGMSGGGGVTTGGGAASSKGAQAPSGGGEVMGLMGQQMAMQLAQIENIKADTEKKKVEAGKIGGVDTELAGAQIKDLLQGVENKKAQQQLTEIQSDLALVEQMFKTRTFNAAVNKLEFETNTAMQQMNIMRNEGIISENTWSTKIDMITTEAAGMILRNAETQGKIKLNAAQVDEVIQSIKTQIKSLEQQGRSLDQKDKDILIDQERNRLIEKGIEWGAASQVLGKVVDVIASPKKGTVVNNTRNVNMTRSETSNYH